MKQQRDLDEVKRVIASHTRWYHKIDLGHGIVTPGLDFDSLWNMIRETRSQLDYRGKSVLDIGSWDGMWAFEAERLGAETVVGTDVQYEAYKNFLLCRDVLGSHVIPMFNVSPYNLWDRLDTFLQERWGADRRERRFDIVQHLGVFYHLRDPMLSLSQARSVMNNGGKLMIETAVALGSDESIMLFNDYPRSRIYDDFSTWWAPTITCLQEMLHASLFRPLPESTRILGETQTRALSQIKKAAKMIVGGPSCTSFTIGRACMIAEAIEPADVDQELGRELMRTYRNPGLHLK